MKQSNATYLGIDPGKSGGLAVVRGTNITMTAMPETETDVWEWLSRFEEVHDKFATIEKVGGFIAGNPAPGSAMFRFGHSVGGLRMALIAGGWAFEDVTPQRWQKALGVPGRKKTDSKSAFKNVLKSAAQRLFPKEKITLATCDAILIMEYCRRKRSGTL